MAGENVPSTQTSTSLTFSVPSTFWDRVNSKLSAFSSSQRLVYGMKSNLAWQTQLGFTCLLEFIVVLPLFHSFLISTFTAPAYILLTNTRRAKTDLYLCSRIGKRYEICQYSIKQNFVQGLNFLGVIMIFTASEEGVY